jgi:hypothetical protein
VARNEDGEFELMLGNKQLLSVFFLMVLLLAVCFVGGYALGRSTAPVLTATVQQTQPVPTIPSPAAVPPEPAVTPPARTAPQVEEKTPEQVKETPPKEVAKQPAKEAAKPAPKVEAKAKTETKAKAAPKEVAAKQAPASGQPVAGRVYLQLSATDKDKADLMVEQLRGKKFAGIAAPVADRPGLFRVLVGPLAETALTQTKAQLKSAGFPGDEAIRRVF